MGQQLRPVNAEKHEVSSAYCWFATAAVSALSVLSELVMR